MDIKQIDRAGKQYVKFSLWLTVALSLMILTAIGLNWFDVKLVNALAVSALYTIIINFAYGLLWRRQAKSSPANMTRLYLASSVVRLITAALVVVSYCMLNQVKEDIRNFVLLFFVFYMIMLVFDSVFFARIEKKNNLKTEK